MCTTTFLLVSKVFLVEYAYVLERFNGLPPGFTSHFDFLLNYTAQRPDIFFFIFITLFTSLALVFFSVHINMKYVRNLTMNEEYKYEHAFKLYNTKLDKIKAYLGGKEEITYTEFDTVRKDVGEVENWLKLYRKGYVDGNYFRRLLSILFF